jgi:hypothetical protein
MIQIRHVGAVLMALGGLVTLFAFSMDTTVYSSGTFVGGELIGGGSSYNLGLLQQQMMILHTGLAGFVAGAFLFGSDASSTIELPRSSAEIEFEIEDERRRIRIGLILLGVVAAIFLVLFLLTRL